MVGAGAGAWFGTVLAAVVCSGELAFSGRVPASTVFPAMILMHALIGVGEAAITCLVVAAVARSRPDLIDAGCRASMTSYRDFFIYGLLVCAALALFVSPFASRLPDGLERVAGELGFASRARPNAVPAPAANYQLPGVHSFTLSTALAALVGTIVVFVIAILIARVVNRRGSSV
jgi:cobalt/nickel transport system permease protein